MKRTSGRSAKMVNDSKGEAGFWPSYADMMSAVALILFFLMLLAYIQNLITGNDLRRTQRELDDTNNALLTTLSLIDSAEAELNNITLDLDKAKEDLIEQQQYIKEQERNLEKQQLAIQVLNDKTLEQADYLAATQAEITELRSQMQTIAVLRLSILEQMKTSIENVMGNTGTVTIGENGSIILSESVLFDLGSSEVKEESFDMLNQLSKVFCTFLADSENARYVDSIVISGHTDSTGSDDSNRVLSTDRANSVLSYLMLTNNGNLNSFAKYFCAAGYGSKRPVQSNDTDWGRAANRRIEISIILKDESVLDIVEQYLAIEMPDTVSTEAENTDSAR